MTNIFGPFFIVSSSVTNFKEQVKRVHKLFDKYCGIYKSFFWGPKRLLETQSFEKRQPFRWRKKFWPIFSRFIEHEKCQGTIEKDQLGFF